MDIGFDHRAMEAAFASGRVADADAEGLEWQVLRARLAAGWVARRAIGDCVPALIVNAVTARAGSFNHMSAKHLAGSAHRLDGQVLRPVNLTVSGNGKPVDVKGDYVAEQSISGDRG